MKPFHVAAETHDRVTDVPPSKSGGPVTLLSHKPHRIGGSDGAALVGACPPDVTCNPTIPSNSKAFIAISKSSSRLYAGVYDRSPTIEDKRWSMLIFWSSQTVVMQ